MMHINDRAVVLCAWLVYGDQAELKYIFRRLSASPPPAARRTKKESGRSWIDRSFVSPSR